MKKLCTLPVSLSLMGSLLLLSLGSASAQNQIFPVTPAHPTDFETRDLGTNKSAVATSSNPEPPKKIRLSFTAVSKSRAWTNATGETVKGRLMAFEAGDHSQSDQLLTVVKNGKVRLLVDGRNAFNLVPLTNLIKADQEYVKGLVEARRQAAKLAQEATETAAATKVPAGQ